MNSSRNSILSALSKNKPAPVSLPHITLPDQQETDLVERFTKVAVSIGSRVFPVNNYEEVGIGLKKLFPDAKQVVSQVADSAVFREFAVDKKADPHALAAVDLAVLQGQFGVAENSAIWTTEEQLGQRVLPFICQHLALIISGKDIVNSMHHAYASIAGSDYGYGVFIAGPSKTADIEQSLVLGAHGPRSLTIFILV